MTENKINPLLDVMSEIDDSIITNSNTVGAVKKSKKRPIIIAAAAAAMLGVAIPVTSGALMRQPLKTEINTQENELGYNVYTDEYGHMIETYVYDIPEYALGEEVEGRTAVGAVRAVYDPDIYVAGGYKLVDEEGNEFLGGINNKYVDYCVDSGSKSMIGFDCANLADGYTTLEFNNEHIHLGGVRIDKCLQVVKEDEIDGVLRSHGYTRNGTAKTAMVNGVQCDIDYDLYVNEYGTLIESIVLDYPEFALKEEREGLNSYGKLRVIYDPKKANTIAGYSPNSSVYKHYLVDEAGNEFLGVNNRMVGFFTFKHGQTYIAQSGIDAANINYSDYTYVFRAADKHTCNGVDVDACLLVYKEEEEYGKYLEHEHAHGIYPELFHEVGTPMPDPAQFGIDIADLGVDPDKLWIDYSNSETSDVTDADATDIPDADTTDVPDADATDASDADVTDVSEDVTTEE